MGLARRYLHAARGNWAVVAAVFVLVLIVVVPQAEALSMSDRIAVMSAGKILQLGTSREIYLQPLSASVARIVGNVNVLHGTVVGSGASQHETEVRLTSGTLFRCRKGEVPPGESNVEILFRPELVGVRLDQGSGGKSGVHGDGGFVNSLSARVNRVDFTGDHLKVHFDTAEGSVIGKLAPDLILPENREVTLLIKAENCVAQ